MENGHNITHNIPRQHRDVHQEEHVATLWANVHAELRLAKILPLQILADLHKLALADQLVDSCSS